MTAEPLEGPPQSELDDKVVSKTISEHPHLFKIITPIHVEVFETYLASHPNRPFVDSVCKGLREGFWPWGRTPCPGYPDTNDESKPPPDDERKAAFLRARRDSEVAKGRFSAPFKHGLSAYLSSRDALHPVASPLWLTSAGTIPTRSFFISRLRLFFANDVAGQSMRAGGATALAEHGVSPAVIQAAGRWASEAFLVYIRKNPTLLQGFLTASHDLPL